MKTLGLDWVGTRTRSFKPTVEFFQRVLELPIGLERPGFVRLDLPDGAAVEVFDATYPEYPHFNTGPVIGFAVADFDAARDEMLSAGIELLLPPGGAPGGYRWQHFRAPDGCVYEITDYPDRPTPKGPFGTLAITQLVWCGTSTEKYSAMVEFVKRMLDLRVVEETTDLLECSLPDGSSFEVFRRSGPMDHPHFRTGPVPTFRVQDIDWAMQILSERGVPLIMTRRRTWGGWAHFKAPDGCIYAVKQVTPHA